MEAAATAKAGRYSLYGSSAHKQVYIYGGLDRSPTELTRSYGMAWGIGGWLLIPFMQKIGPEGMDRIRRRVAGRAQDHVCQQLHHEVSLVGALQLDAIADYGRAATGAKYLINPNE